MKNIINTNIETVGDLKELLNNYNDTMLINFGTRKLGFEINSHSADCISLALMSDDLEEYLQQ
jgi:hypothetical protein